MREFYIKKNYFKLHVLSWQIPCHIMTNFDQRTTLYSKQLPVNTALNLRAVVILDMLYHPLDSCVLTAALETGECIFLLLEELALGVPAEDVPGQVLLAPVRGFAEPAD